MSSHRLVPNYSHISTQFHRRKHMYVYTKYSVKLRQYVAVWHEIYINEVATAGDELQDRLAVIHKELMYCKSKHEINKFIETYRRKHKDIANTQLKTP